MHFKVWMQILTVSILKLNILRNLKKTKQYHINKRKHSITVSFPNKYRSVKPVSYHSIQQRDILSEKINFSLFYRRPVSADVFVLTDLLIQFNRLLCFLVFPFNKLISHAIIPLRYNYISFHQQRFHHLKNTSSK